MRWLAKAAGQRALGLLPNEGEGVNYALQRHVIRSLPASPQTFRKKFSRALQHQRVYEEHTGASASDATFYEFGTGNNPTFGYTNLGLAVSVPLAFIPASFGTWTAKASMNWLYLGETLKTVNNGDRNQIIGTFGIAFSY